MIILNCAPDVLQVEVGEFISTRSLHHFSQLMSNATQAILGLVVDSYLANDLVYLLVILQETTQHFRGLAGIANREVIVQVDSLAHSHFEPGRLTNERLDLVAGANLAKRLLHISLSRQLNLLLVLVEALPLRI